ncbi:DUF5753 domain-containing protein [Streptomyces sp. NPDC051572]|uniref:DUF5753 domain-containing protein n=1 Tax=Streptomyces sp. NPDC051572 TaxID=3155802 RepID=UPI00344BBC0E
MTEARSAPTLPQMVLGRRLTALREAAGMSAAEAARTFRGTTSTVTRMEKAETRLNFAKVKILLEAYGVSQQEKEEFLELLVKADEPGWWQSFRDALPAWFGVHVSLETDATQIRSYEPAVVPGLLQTADYARAVLERGLQRIGPELLERRVDFRTRRQEILTRVSPAPPLLWAIMDETCLRRPVGNPDVMAAQLDHLLLMSSLPNVTLQVYLHSNGLHAAGFGPYTVFRFEIPELPDIVCIDILSGVIRRESRDEVSLFRQAFDQMAVAALSRAATRSFIADIRKELYP